MNDFFMSNRQRLITKLNGGLVILSAYTGMQRGNDEAFAFEQEANFWWLCGIEEPDWWLIADGSRGKTWLVAPTKSESHQIFDGSLALDRAKKISGADEVITHDKITMLLRDLAKKHSVVYALGEQPYAEYFDFCLNPTIKRTHDILARNFVTVQDCRKDLAELRAIKQPQEITLMKKAINLTTDAFRLVKPMLAEMTHEYEAEAEFSYYFRKHGADGHAYDPIVAAGKNACTLHYVKNKSKLRRRDLLLLDIGARMNGYSADITRTFSLGEPSKRQIEVHEAVRSVQAQVIRLIKPDLSVEQYQRESDAIMADALMKLGLMLRSDDKKNFRKYFPHAVSHGLGVDTHDSLGAPKFLQPGMVLTVEPGIYIPEEGIGVRIEDDIHVTASGNVNLSGRLSTDL